MKRIRVSSELDTLDTIVKIELTINELLNIYAAVTNIAPRNASKHIISNFHLPYYIEDALIGDMSNPNLHRISHECKDILREFGYTEENKSND